MYRGSLSRDDLRVQGWPACQPRLPAVYAACTEGWLAVIVERLVYATRRGYVGAMCSGCEPGVNVLATYPIESGLTAVSDFVVAPVREVDADIYLSCT